MILWEIVKDRFSGWANSQIDEAAHANIKELTAALDWLASTPVGWSLLIFVLVICVLLIHSYCFVYREKIEQLTSQSKASPYIDIELTPSSGPSPDIRLAVKNLGVAGKFSGTCRIVAVRNDPNKPRTGVFNLHWKSDENKRIKIAKNEGQELLIARRKIWREHDFCQIDILEWSNTGPQEFTGARWNLGGEEEPLPEFDLEISIFQESGSEAKVAKYTLRPAGQFGPLEMMPLMAQNNDVPKDNDYRTQLEQPTGPEGTPFPDMTIGELFSYICDDTDFISQGAEVLDCDNWKTIGDDIRDKASVGQLAFWGRAYGEKFGDMLGKNPLTGVPKEYWNEGDFTYLFLDGESRDVPHTYRDPGEDELRDLQVNKSQVLSIWAPKK